MWHPKSAGARTTRLHLLHVQGFGSPVILSMWTAARLYADPLRTPIACEARATTISLSPENLSRS